MVNPADTDTVALKTGYVSDSSLYMLSVDLVSAIYSLQLFNTHYAN